jgi:uncharacterized membrane protein YgcG
MSAPVRNISLRRIAAALALLLLSAGRAPAAEVIHSFDSNVEVAKDGELTVTETIRVRAEHIAIRHGIYRDFPLMFRDAAGSLHDVTFSILGLSRDGRPEPYHTERTHGVIRIFAGDRDALVPYGDHTYVLRYHTGRQIRWFNGKPELNWNVTGNFWNFPIFAASYRLHLAGNARVLRWTAYTGRLGARGIDWRGAIARDGTLTVVATRPLYPGEGLTVVAELPGSAVEPPSASTLLWYGLFDNRRWIFGSLGFLLVLGYYFAAWEAVGRDPKRGTIIPLFHPPAGISPALANYIRDWGFGREKWRAFTAACLSLAVRGLVRFSQTGTALTLEATGKQPEGGFASLPAGERAIFNGVNEKGAATIDRAHGERIAKVGAEFTTSIEAENRNRFFRRNLSYVVIGLAMTAAVVAVVIMFGGLQDEDIVIMAGMGFAAFWLGMFLVPMLMAVFGRDSIGTVVRAALSLIVIGAFVSFIVIFVQAWLPSGFGEMLPALSAAVAAYPFPIALVAAFTSLNGLFFYLMRAPTALGRPIMDQLSGFRLYLETAEADRLNMQGAPEITAERFEALLPYAVALDVEKPWAHAFAAALRRAHPDDADPMRHYQPAWTSGGSWSGRDFSSAVVSSVSSVSSALASAVPASSGSSGVGGGGGSGGGGGGGGGGGW